MISFDEFRATILGTDDEDIKAENKKLCERYPFLIPRNNWTGEIIKNFNYEFTNLDDLPFGWRKAFGLQMVEELRDILIEGDYLNDYRVVQIKEKFGGLRWYDNGVPKSIYDRYDVWLDKYETISYKTCIICGAPGKMVYSGWISPYCESCFHNYFGEDKDYKKWTRENEGE